MQGLAVRSLCRAGSDVRPPVLAAVLGLHQRGPFNRPCFAIPEVDGEPVSAGGGSAIANGDSARSAIERRLKDIELSSATLNVLAPLRDALIEFVHAHLRPLVDELVSIRNALGQISEQFAALNDTAATKQQLVEVHERVDRELQDVDRTIAALERRIETLETEEIPIDLEEESARTSLVDLSKRLGAELRGYHETTQHAQIAFKEVSRLLKEANGRSDQLAAQNQQVIAQNQQLATENDRLRREITDIMRRNEELSARNAQLDDTIRTLSTRVSQATLDLARAQRRHEEDGLELSRARIAMQELINASSALRDQVAELRIEVIELRGKLGNH